MNSIDHPRHPVDAPPRSSGTGASRRFTLGTLMVITALYAAMFGVATWMQMPPLATGIMAGFITAVGIAQAVLYHGRRPREASLLAGSLLCAGGSATVSIWCYATGENSPEGPLLLGTVLAPLLGAGLGYLAGGLVGGVFLIAARLRKPTQIPEKETQIERSPVTEVPADVDAPFDRT